MAGTEAVALVGVVAAVLGYFVTYGTNLRLAQRKDRLERINQQLSEFYGPLLALTQSSGQSWQAFRKRYRPWKWLVLEERSATHQGRRGRLAALDDHGIHARCISR